MIFFEENHRRKTGRNDVDCTSAGWEFLRKGTATQNDRFPTVAGG